MIDMKNKVVLIAAAIVLLGVALFVIHGLSASKKAGAPLSPDTVPSRVEMASRLANPTHDEAEIQKAEDLIAKEPDSAKSENAYWRLAAIYERKQDLLSLKEIYQKIIDKFPSSKNILKAQEAIENTNVRLIFSDLANPDSSVYVVRKGDSLYRIAKKFNTTVELIMRSNSLKSDALNTGKKLTITKLKFSIAVDKSQNILTLKADGNIFKTYRVSTGKDSCTPVGTFKIITKIVNPPWYKDNKVIPAGDPKNVLGSRWLGISKPSYGIHGTTDPLSIGKSVTDGCVRMKNAEVEELYQIVPAGTEVVIVD